MSTQIYLVGGAVRDQLLGLPVYDKDWVVVGATPEQMESDGYQSVGKQFPVFLHPKTKEEYALARKERKSGTGYTGFICDFSPDISLEEDLERRDLTINAIAQDSDGNFYDPYNGQRDLKDRVFRHVSDAFVEDPLRVLRVARFAARFHAFGFKVAPETLELMADISHSGELAALTPERVWKETEKSLSYPDFPVYFDILNKVSATPHIFPELSSCSQRLNELSSLKKNHTYNATDRWALMCCYLELSDAKSLNQRLKVPNIYKWISEETCYFLSNKTLPLKAQNCEDWLTKIAATKKVERFSQLTQLLSDILKLDVQNWQSLLTAIQSVSPQKLISKGYKGAELGKALKLARIDALNLLDDNPLIES